MEKLKSSNVCNNVRAANLFFKILIANYGHHHKVGEKSITFTKKETTSTQNRMANICCYSLTCKFKMAQELPRKNVRYQTFEDSVGNTID